MDYSQLSDRELARLLEQARTKYTPLLREAAARLRLLSDRPFNQQRSTKDIVRNWPPTDEKIG